MSVFAGVSLTRSVAPTTAPAGSGRDALFATLKRTFTDFSGDNLRVGRA
jgi:hypothetical protein